MSDKRWVPEKDDNDAVTEQLAESGRKLIEAHRHFTAHMSEAAFYDPAQSSIPRATFEAWSASMRHDLALALGMEICGSVPTWPMIAYRARAMREEKVRDARLNIMLAAKEQERHPAAIQAHEKTVLDHLNGIIGARFTDNKTPTWQEIETRLRELVSHEKELSRIADLVGFSGSHEFPAAGVIEGAVRAIVHHPRRMSGSRTIDAAMRHLYREADESKLDTVPGVEKPKLTILFDDPTEVP